MTIFRKAERRKAKLRLSIDGPSGSGKTLSSLLIAYGITSDWQKIAVIDTERGSADLYTGTAIPGSADVIGEYLVATMGPPFSPDNYIATIKAAEKTGAEVLIIDSLSHAWSGVGGVLDMHDAATKASRSKNSYTAWRDVTPAHNSLIDSIIGCPLHVICTMRTKTHYDMEDDGHGRKKPVKVGMRPEQREGTEYEFTVVLDLAVDSHVAVAGKDRTQLFDGKPAVVTVATGQALRNWLETGVDPIQLAKDEIAAADDVDLLRDVCSRHKSAAQVGGWVDQLAELFRLQQELILAGEDGGAKEPPTSADEGTSPATNTDKEVT